MPFDRTKGMAYCGLSCAACSGNDTCAGCRKEGCKDKDWCKNFKCCKEKNLNGCWECGEFPCAGSMLDKMKIRVFATAVSNLGEEKILDCFERNECDGIVYHHPGTYSGDYDEAGSEAAVLDLLLNGRKILKTTKIL